MKPIQTGFTLLEAMIVVAIIGILLAIAFPSYDEYVKRGNRSEGQAFLHDVSAREEKYFTQNNAYVINNNDIGKLALKNGRESETGKYTLSVLRNDDDGGYTLIATQNFGDTKCGNLTLNALGTKGAEGNVKDCWK